MLQVNNGFDSCYYMTESGEVWNEKENKYLKLSGKHLYRIKQVDGRYRLIALKTLYQLVFHKNFCLDVIDDLENEQWKEIPNTNGVYEVSNKGRVKSKAGYEAIILKPLVNKCGYERLDIIVDGKRQSKLVHRLVADSFLERPKSIDYQIHHKDLDKKNNSVENLEWLSVAEHKRKHMKKEANNGSAEPKDNNNRADKRQG